MGFWNKKQQEKQEESKKPTKRRVLMEIVLTNNRTDKEYYIKSENDFGITWTGTEGKPIVWCVNQYQSFDKDDITAIGRYADFSIVKTVYETIDI